MGVTAETKILMKKVGEIKPYVRNPRRNERTVELLCDLIPKVGFNVPLVIDENGVIVKGHARYTAAIRLGMEEVPCIVSHASEEAVKVDRITDNKIAEYSEWINGDVYEEIESINTEIDFNALGFPRVDFSEMPQMANIGSERDENADDGGLSATDGNIAQIQNNGDAKKYYKFVCKDCGHVMFIAEEEVSK